MSKKTEKQMSKGKKALNIALVVLQIAIVVVAIAFSISILLSTGYESSGDFGNASIRLMPVLTDSMAGDKEDSFKSGDLIIVKNAENVDLSTLKVGDIITYLDNVGGDLQFVTHRIISIEESELSNGTVIRGYTTMGDAEDPETAVTKTLYAGDIKGVYIGKLAGVGNAVFWLQDPTHFFLVIMLPLILLLLYNAYLVVRIVMEAKLKKQREQLIGATSEGSVRIDEEEIKRLAVEEYIKKKAVEDYIKEQELNAARSEIAEVAVGPAETAEPSPEQIKELSEEEKKEEAQGVENVSVENSAKESANEGEVSVPVETAAEQAEAEEKTQAPTDAGQIEEGKTVAEQKPENEDDIPAENAQTGEAENISAKAEESKAEEASKPEVKKPAAKKTAAAKSKAESAAKPSAKTTKKPATKSVTKSATKSVTKSAAESASKTTAKTATKSGTKKTEKNN